MTLRGDAGGLLTQQIEHVVGITPFAVERLCVIVEALKNRP
jgi:hypothetical protein